MDVKTIFGTVSFYYSRHALSATPVVPRLTPTSVIFADSPATKPPTEFDAESPILSGRQMRSHITRDYKKSDGINIKRV